MSEDALRMYTVYDHPDDFPADYVAREWVIQAGQDAAPGQVVVRAPDLEVVRMALSSQGLHRLERQPEDDPKIVETWL